MPALEPGQGLILDQTRAGRRALADRHDGGDTGVATVCFFDPSADVGVVALGNGNWRTVEADYALYLIMDRLFEAAPALGRAA